MANTIAALRNKMIRETTRFLEKHLNSPSADKVIFGNAWAPIVLDGRRDVPAKAGRWAPRFTRKAQVDSR